MPQSREQSMTKDEALRLALEALEADELAMIQDKDGHMVYLKDQAITAIKAALEAKDEPVQVSPFEFVEMVMEKEDCIGKPIIWAEWPNKEKNT
jgi:hypothetical protein